MSSECAACGQQINIGDWPYCDHGRPHGGTRLQAIHTSERSVLYVNPRTGETRTPARADQPMPAVYAAQGYERRELSTAQSIRDYEKRTGKIHEASNYDRGSATAERELTASLDGQAQKPDLHLRHKLAQALR